MRGLVFAGALLLACQAKPDHPVRAPECTVENDCSGSGPSFPVGGGAAPSQGGAGPGEPGQAGEAGDAALLPGELVGTLRELVDDSFRTSIPFTGAAELRAEGQSQAIVSAAWNGVDPFRLEAVARATPQWLSVEPSAGSARLPTLHPIPSPHAASLNLGLIRADTLDFIFSLQTVPSERLAGYGHVVLLLTRASGFIEGVEGVTVRLADAGLLAYSVGGTWSDLDDRTDASGKVVLGNIRAPGFPGATKRIALSGTRTGFVEVRVAADATSLVEVPLPAP